MRENSNKSMLMLIAGPYRSGTNDDPALMRNNVQMMESYALPIFRAGHTPVIGEWLALPLVDLAGSRKVGDEPFNEVFHPIATRLLEKCDAVLRVGGPFDRSRRDGEGWPESWPENLHYSCRNPGGRFTKMRAPARSMLRRQRLLGRAPEPSECGFLTEGRSPGRRDQLSTYAYK